MNPPISGQNMAQTYRAVERGVGPGRGAPDPKSAPGSGQSSVECYLLLRRGEGPGHLQAALLTEDESHLGGGTKALGVVGPIRCAGANLGQRAEVVVVKEAVLAACLRLCRARCCHARPRPRSSLSVRLNDGWIK